MKVLFVYSVQKTITQRKPLLGQEGINHGISSIAGVLKSAGNECRLAVLDRRHKNKNIKLLTERIRQFSPQIVAFTAVYSEFEFIWETASAIKKVFPKLFFLIGGVHVTLNPDEKYLSVFDAVCIGEGEYPVLELVQRMKAGERIDDIQNLWVKTSGDIQKNPARPFISNLDEIPFSDREMWQEWILNTNTRIAVLAGRGCPFNCTYCSNHRLRKAAEGRYVRMRSPENIVSEIKELHLKFPEIKELYLEVETIAADLSWFENLCSQLRQFGRETNDQIKFETNLRIFQGLDVEFVFQQFQKANIKMVTIGLESGSYRIRKKILNRDYSNELILRTAETAERYGIQLALFNMVGLPTETIEEFKETLKMNQIIQPLFHATSIFFPYQGTALYERCKKMSLLPEKLRTKDERQLAVLDLPEFSRKQIQRSFDSFHYNVYKVRKDKSKIKQFVYFTMCFLGHNFYADMKIKWIRLLYGIKALRLINSKLFSIFQKNE